MSDHPTVPVPDPDPDTEPTEPVPDEPIMPEETDDDAVDAEDESEPRGA